MNWLDQKAFFAFIVKSKILKFFLSINKDLTNNLHSSKPQASFTVSDLYSVVTTDYFKNASLG